MIKSIDKTKKTCFKGELISNIFYENSFKLFKEFCKDNGFEYDYQLKKFDFNLLKEEKGFGPLKINTIIERWNEYTNRKKKINKESIFNEEVNIHEDYTNMNINKLKGLFVEQRIIEYFIENKIDTIGEITPVALKNISTIPNVGKSKVLKFESNLKLLQYPKEELSIKLLAIIKKDENYKIYKMRAVKDITLQSIADENGISRERVRQLENRVQKKFNGYFSLFFNYMKEIIGKNKIFDYRHIKRFIKNKEDALVLRYALINGACDMVQYFQEINKFIIDERTKDIKIKLALIEEEVGEIFNYYDSLYVVEQMLKDYELGFLDYEDFITYLYSRGYKSHNDYLWKGSMKLSKCYGVIVKEYFKDGIKLSDEKNIERVTAIFKRKFGREDFCDNIRAISARIESENVLCDRGTYISPEYIRIPKWLLKEIKNYILDSKEDTLLISDIFYVFEDKLRKSGNVTNRYFLHGVLKYYYKEEFVFTKDSISKGEHDIISSHKIFEKFLEEKKRPVSKKEIRKIYPGWTESMFNNAVALNKNIIYWDNGYFINSDILKIDYKDKDKLEELLIESFRENNNYTNANVFYDKCTSDFPEFIEKNSIKNSFNIYSILEYIFGDKYYFRRPHILLDEQKNQFTTLDLFYELFNKQQVISYEEFSQHFIKLKFTERTIYNAFHRVLDELIELDDDRYMQKKNFNLSKDILGKIKKGLDLMMDDRGYYPLKTVQDFTFLPDVKFKWNQYLLSSIVENYIQEYKIIEKNIKDRRYKCSILVPNDGKFNSIKDIILYILKNEYSGKMNILDIQEYLRDRGVILKGIPKEVFKCTDFIVNDDGQVIIDK
ncbi:sigma factor-like helix-turn-helix DNA-binding protein [Clostridium frigidicarnis]|uniref:Sigma-70, region 4 n=1 Tax=Clostridium frigidicarnis TaxID=84698 RepID=A0A1I0ZB10_9CLOT|nr:sigma factor-like helix-turn-helix DNA-binding protein [Clostridium frigidicarnis]SFB22939.1 Sigma-70, region 4 [Clostridium frigidicarnis]